MIRQRSHAHLRQRTALEDCEEANHRFGSPKPIGGGISRQVCEVCGAVSIDLVGAERPSDPTLRPERGDR